LPPILVMFSTVKRQSTSLSNRRTARRKQRKIKINPGRDNASVSSCDNNEDCGFLKVMPLVYGNSPTFPRNLQAPSAIHKKLPIPEDFVTFTAVRTPNVELQIQTTHGITWLSFISTEAKHKSTTGWQ